MAEQKTYLSNDLEGVYDLMEATENIEYYLETFNKYFEFEEYWEAFKIILFEVNSKLEEFKDMLAAQEQAEAEAINREYLKSVSL